jgi:hypothetical protein
MTRRYGVPTVCGRRRTCHRTSTPSGAPGASVCAIAASSAKWTTGGTGTRSCVLRLPHSGVVAPAARSRSYIEQRRGCFYTQYHATCMTLHSVGICRFVAAVAV